MYVIMNEIMNKKGLWSIASLSLFECECDKDSRKEIKAKKYCEAWFNVLPAKGTKAVRRKFCRFSCLQFNHSWVVKYERLGLRDRVENYLRF